MNERCSSQDQALNNVPFNACCGMPDLFWDLVSFPEPLLIEQVDSFPQRFLFSFCRNTSVNGSERYHLRDLGFEETLGSIEIGLVREEVELDRTRAYPEVQIGRASCRERV